MAGAPVRSMLGWVPTSGDQPIGICLFTYDGTVNVGVATDIRMIPDPLRIAELVEGHPRDGRPRHPIRVVRRTVIPYAAS